MCVSVFFLETLVLLFKMLLKRIVTYICESAVSMPGYLYIYWYSDILHIVMIYLRFFSFVCFCYCFYVLFICEMTQQFPVMG